MRYRELWEQCYLAALTAIKTAQPTKETDLVIKEALNLADLAVESVHSRDTSHYKHGDTQIFGRSI